MEFLSTFVNVERSRLYKDYVCVWQAVCAGIVSWVQMQWVKGHVRVTQQPKWKSLYWPNQMNYAPK